MKRKGEEKRVVIGLLGVILILLPCMGHTAIPQTINYQGYLTNAEGVPVNGTVQMVFSIYNVDTGGTALDGVPECNAHSRGLQSNPWGGDPNDFNL